MARYSKRDREHAARILSALAAEHARIAVSGCDFTTDRWTWANSGGFGMAIGATKRAVKLVGEAIRAEMSMRTEDGRDPTLRAIGCAEAEALIRTGWSPQSAARRARKAGR